MFLTLTRGRFGRPLSIRSTFQLRTANQWVPKLIMTLVLKDSTRHVGTICPLIDGGIGGTWLWTSHHYRKEQMCITTSDTRRNVETYTCKSLIQTHKHTLQKPPKKLHRPLYLLIKSSCLHWCARAAYGKCHPSPPSRGAEPFQLGLRRLSQPAQHLTPVFKGPGTGE